MQSKSEDARGSMRTPPCIWNVKLLYAEHRKSRSRQMKTGGTPHSSDTDDDDIEAFCSHD
jgi:hypothetical protein